MTKLLFISGLLLSVVTTASGAVNQVPLSVEDVAEISVTRQTYLEKIHIIERQLSAIELKWNIVVADPVEDSIAKAEGWYTFMDKRREELKTEVVHVKLEQLINYYNDILKFHVSAETIEQKLIPEMQENRKQVSPDYPSHIMYLPASENEVTALKLWIVSYEAQYDAFTNSLEQLVINYL